MFKIRGTREIAQCVRTLFQQAQEPEFKSQAPHEKPAIVVYACNPSIRWDPAGHEPASLAGMMTSPRGEKTLSQGRRQSNSGRHSSPTLASVCAPMGTLTPLHTHIYSAQTHYTLHPPTQILIH